MSPDPNKRPKSIALVNRAIKRNDLLRWLLPVLLVLLAIGASMPSIAHPVSPIDEPQLVVDTVVRRDTIVLASIINEPPKYQATKSPITRKDSILNIKRREYEQLYSAYLDSIKSIPDSSFMRAFNFQTQYAEAMYNALQRHLSQYPEYSDEINKEYLTIYERDLPRIAESYKGYKFE